MDDSAFERWTEKQTELRKNRQTIIDQAVQDKADSFGPDEFYRIAQESVEKIMDTWLELEQGSWQQNPPDNVSEALDNTRSEMDSILDFEIEAIDRDRVSVVSRITWAPDSMNQEMTDFQTVANEIRKKYQLKINGLGGGSKKKRAAESPMPVPSTVRSSGGSSGGSGFSMLVMFVVGLLLGGAPSYFFMDNVKKSEKKFGDERKKMQIEQQALSDSVTVLHENFERLAYGKIKNIPELDHDIEQIKSRFAQRRQQIDANYQQQRDRVLRKVPAGNRQDNAISELTSDRDIQLAEARKQEEAAVGSLQKQRDVLAELLKH